MTSKMLVFFLIALVSSKNIILIGDSRTVGIAVYLFGFGYTYAAPYYGTGTYIVSTIAKSYGGHSAQVACETGASYATFTNSAKAVSTGAHKLLASAASGTVVLLWLGVNNLDSASTFNYYQSLAKKYQKLKFYAISVTGVSSKSNISNATIKTFNTNMNNKIKSAGLANLKYKSILIGEDPTKVGYGGTVYLTIDTTTTDTYGLHYYTNGYKAIYNSMVNGI